MDLTSLPAVKNWLNVTTNNDDTLLSRLITQISQAALNELQRPSIARATYTELRDGVGNQRMTLRNWPVVSVTSLQVGPQVVPSSLTFGQTGYTLETWDGTSSGAPQSLTLNGYGFARGKNNVQIVYQAGYCVSAQAATVSPGNYLVKVKPPLGSWCQDDGISYASTGAALAPVASSPAAGQYTVNVGSDGTVVYGFNASDAGAAVRISYSFVPGGLEEAVIEWVGERYSYKQRIGQKSKSVGGNETFAYDLSAIPKHIDQMLSGYRKFLPV